MSSSSSRRGVGGVDNAREGFFEPADLEKMLAELPEHLRPLTRFAALTGWRKGECLSLRWANVGSRAARSGFYTSKNKEGRSFPFGPFPQLRRVLEDQRARTRAVERETGRIIPHVFHHDGGKPIRDFNSGWRAARKRVKLPGVLFHDLRRTAVRNMERAGVPRSVAMKLTGHKTEAVYRRYAIADVAALAEGVEKLAALHQRTGTDGGPSIVPISEAR